MYRGQFHWPAYLTAVRSLLKQSGRPPEELSAASILRNRPLSRDSIVAATFTLINTDDGVYEADFWLNQQSSGISQFGDQWSVQLQRLHGGLSDGVDVIWIDNGCSRIAILPTRGMGVWKAEVAGLPLEWKSPVERPVHPAYVDQMRRGGIGWLDGFNELVCRCGLGWHGAPGTDTIKDDKGNVVSKQFLPLHGRIANLPAHDVRVAVSDDGAISVIGVIDEASVFGGRLRLTSALTTRIGSNAFEIQDTIQNLGSSAAEAEMLYHCNIGRPFLGEGATFHTAAEVVAPRDARAAEDVDTWTNYRAPISGYAEQVYFAKPISDSNGRGIAVLKSSSGSEAVCVRFDTDTLPWLALWKNTQAEEDGYCTGIEPASSFPNLRSFEREHGRVITLESQQSITFNLAMSVADDSDDVSKLVSEVESLQGESSLKLHREPLAEWSA